MYILRNDQGKVIGAFALPQVDFDVELVAEDDPELLAFLNPPKEKEE
ncbi:hypothetical protein [Pseudomonas extremaustralis]|nr:hypothetical protein [Pseudomonas extremaustralis]MDB1108060.1 hypothetical protein [Pseudomonas extremaustralis]